MKRLLLILVLALALAGCRKTNDAECSTTWKDADLSDAIGTLGMGTVVEQLYNTKMLPGTVGEYLQQCLEDGWRPPGL